MRNIPKSRVFGVEAELTVRPVTGLTLSGAVTYLDTKIEEYTGVDYVGTPRDFAGQTLPFASKWNYSLSADYRMQTASGGTPFFGANVNGRSSADTVPGGRTITAVNTVNSRVLPGLVYPFRTNGFATVDGRIGYEAADGRWTAMVWAKNIFNTYYWTNVVTASDFSARYAGMPATYGVTLAFKIR